jgi:hypothetical protein
MSNRSVWLCEKWCRREYVFGVTTLQCSGVWRHHVFVRGPLLAKLRPKLGRGELRLIYAAGRLCLNALSIPAGLDTDLEKFGERKALFVRS